MGKIEDMRRLREQQFAELNDVKRAIQKSASTSTTATAPEKVATTASASTNTKTAPAADEGKCSVCGKMKPLTNGLVANHQKGFGKACAGSRKEPA